MNLFRAVAASSVVLLVVGSGAAIGMATSPSGHHRGAVAGSTGSTTVASSPPTSTTTVPPTTAVTTTTTSPPAGTPGGPARSSTSGSAFTGPSPGSSAPGRPASGSHPASPPPASTSASGGALPSPGTYSYATSGTSKVAFFGSSSYPSTTTIVVTRQGCGEASQWNSGSGNTTTVQQCPVTGGIHVVSESSTIQSHGYSQSMTFTCSADSFVPTSGTPGRTWRWACTSSNGETASEVVKLLGPETLTVAGRPVATEHVTVDTTLSGPDQGSATTDYWLTSYALPVKETGSINASQNGFSYSSNYTLEADSLTPSS